MSENRAVHPVAMMCRVLGVRWYRARGRSLHPGQASGCMRCCASLHQSLDRRTVERLGASAGFLTAYANPQKTRVELLGALS